MKGVTVKDFYHSFCPTLGYLKNATRPSPSFLVAYVFGVFGVYIHGLYTSSGERCAPYNFVPSFLACNVQSKSACLTMHQVK